MVVSQTNPNFRQEIDSSKQLVQDLFKPQKSIYWSDCLLSAAIGWSAFALGCVRPLSGWGMVAVAIAAIALYRALIFLHEITHLRRHDLPGFAGVWNLLVGMPLLLPTFVYLGVHSDHHRSSGFGTERDPEYLPLAGKPRAIVGFIAQSLLIPILLPLRFLVLAPVGLLLPRFHRFLERHASSFVINPAYIRQVEEKQRSQMKATEAAILGLWSVSFILAIEGVLPWRVYGVWYSTMAIINLINILRTLGAHEYREGDRTRDLMGQVLDSVDTPGNFWTVIWAPVGLRYHALHHYFPSMPYHNLPIAYRRLIAELPETAAYRQATRPSLWQSLRKLWIG